MLTTGRLAAGHWLQEADNKLGNELKSILPEQMA